MAKVSNTPIAAGCFRAKLRAIDTSSVNVRLELFTEHGQPMQLEIPQRDFKSLNVEVGSEVFVSSKELKVFLEDFMI